MASRRRVLSVVGTRPNMMKIAPIAAELARRGDEFEHVLVHTGQHYDRELSEIFLEELGVGRAGLRARSRLRFARAADGARDGAARAGAARDRAGRRARPRRRELDAGRGADGRQAAASRSATSRRGCARSTGRCRRRSTGSSPTSVSQLLFIHSPEARDNLLAEGCPAEAIHDVGNTMIDSLVAMRERIDAAGAPEARGLVRGEYLVVTLHRPSLVDGPLLAEAVTQLEVVSDALDGRLPRPSADARVARGARASTSPPSGCG